MFVAGHGPFPSFLNRLHLSDSDSCACGEVGDPIHYVTSCPLNFSWHIRKPSTSLDNLWFQRVLENLNLRKRIINMIKFIIENENIMRLEKVLTCHCTITLAYPALNTLSPSFLINSLIRSNLPIPCIPQLTRNGSPSLKRYLKPALM
ncbi:hypothetical protein AVEN_68325-1 [Araneus ventricosus]|uniref:Uncharacterized protein n=1 Tax=Araneus ventricosus TaxID=182803 RepID=A0A4Y2GJC4_ARAVE|nr:hypothetical protein AVEN_68325-1 [Araneus ventricosus]